jgi:hypothetical protein
MNGPEERKVKSLGELPVAIEPPRDLWPGIEARLKAPGVTVAAVSPRPAGARLAQLRWLAAAAMVASVAVGVWIGREVLPLSGGAATAPQSAASTASPASPEAAALNASYVSDPRYQRQRTELLKTLQARIEAMPPPARLKVTASLATIEHAKEDLERALGKDPSNALLQELLINTYQDEMRALTDVHEASDPGRGI